MRLIGLILCGAFVTACDPHIGVTPLQDTLEGNSISYVVDIEPNGNRIVDVAFSYYPKYRHPSDPIKLSARQGEEVTRWNGEFTPSEPGPYRLLVSVSYRSPLGIVSFGETTLNAVRDVTVHETLASSCFSFDGGENDFQGWTTSAVFDGASKARISKGNCPDLLFLNRSWPHGLDVPVDGGSLFIPVSPSCFPKTSTEVSRHGMWRFDLISPDVSDLAAWQALKRLEFRFATQTMPVHLIPMIRYRQGNQTITHRLLPSGEAAPYLEAIPGTWLYVKTGVDLPKDAQIQNIMVRVMGTPEQTVTPQVGSLFLDGVCPVE